ITNKGERYRIKGKLKEINDKLDSKDFFQINRQTILSKNSVKSISPHMNRKLKVKTFVDFEVDLIIPKSKTSEFIKWMEF
ncbi:MAG: LytTR family transcriptional regulator, partial [Flavobacteriales bacterium]|nr:LytTR family transcriptional regulator [Flavobacteriales bacterium]